MAYGKSYGRKRYAKKYGKRRTYRKKRFSKRRTFSKRSEKGYYSVKVLNVIPVRIVGGSNEAAISVNWFAREGDLSAAGLFNTAHSVAYDYSTYSGGTNPEIPKCEALFT